MFELVDNVPQSAVIKVIGVGGGGGNAVKHMIENSVDGVDFICANTDAQALSDVESPTVLQLGGEITKGLGAGANPEIGRAAAMEDRERIAESLRGADMVFITAGMGGGTGTGGAPIVAEIAREMGILTVAVVTRPFSFEGRKRQAIAEAGLGELQQHVDSLITIPNEKLLEVLGKNTSLLDAFKEANDVLLGAVQGIADLIIRPGMINVDFADVRTVMSEMGMAMMGTGSSRGENRAREAAERAINSPLLDDIDLEGARGILVNITAGLDLSLGEFSEVGDTIEEFASEEATVVVGTVIDPDLQDELRVTVVATGLGNAVTRARLQVVDTPRTARVERPERVEADDRGERREPAEPVMAAGVPDYADYDRPPQRRTTRGGGATAEKLGEDYFDIPAFLRRQAD
ncbi:MAG: cell division protein FtsZ [Halieaceae bacterium]|jgi:cell division protein FtsZ|nr:cell division protein FtsZ [Halieaceae bacterium]